MPEEKKPNEVTPQVDNKEIERRMKEKVEADKKAAGK
jgi:hypothetical protein